MWEKRIQGTRMTTGRDSERRSESEGMMNILWIDLGF